MVWTRGENGWDRIPRKVSIAEVSGCRVLDRPWLDWIDGVKVAWAAVG